ncbi:MAG TPA: 6-carboxytetrahydropterin synthase [Rubricoccaceae bacterium]|nr:6-carboxytetrahydropterin synthase [Rubricoccaceae bacterium]
MSSSAPFQIARVAKRFRWEAAHRLPYHDGACSHLHGHSYRMTVEVEGVVDDGGMVLDFQAIKKLVSPLVEVWDHATLVAAHDVELLGVVRQTGWKHFVFPADTTSEHLAAFVADHLRSEGNDVLRRAGVRRVRVRLAETETCYAEVERLVHETAPAGNGAERSVEATP